MRLAVCMGVAMAFDDMNLFMGLIAPIETIGGAMNEKQRKRNHSCLIKQAYRLPYTPRQLSPRNIFDKPALAPGVFCLAALGYLILSARYPFYARNYIHLPMRFLELAMMSLATRIMTLFASIYLDSKHYFNNVDKFWFR